MEKASKAFFEFWAKLLPAFLAQYVSNSSRWDFQDMNAKEDLSLHAFPPVGETGS